MGKKSKRQATTAETIAAYDSDEQSMHLRLRSDPIFFCENICGLKPHRKQRDFLSLPIWESQHVMMPWGRQFGKSVITAYWLAWCLFALSGYRAFLFSPSGDQTKEIMERLCHVYETSPYLKTYMPSHIKGNVLTVGSKEWDSKCELVRVGLTGDLGRGRSSDGKGVVVYDEFASFLYGDQIRGTLNHIVASGGGEVVLSSPGDPGSEMDTIRLLWKQLQADGNKRYHVIECQWSDTDHLSKEWMEDQRREMTAKGRLWEFEREVLGKWVKPANAWFDEASLKRCISLMPVKSNPSDQFIWAMDLGGRGKSAFVIAIAKFSQTHSRLEVVDLRSFFFENHKYRRKTEGSEIVESYDQIVEILCDLRLKYPPSWCGVDPATENSLTQRLANSYAFPIEEILVGSNPAKEKYLTALQKGIREAQIVWNDDRITRQLRGFAPKRKPDGNGWEFPKEDTDIVVTMMNLYQYLGQREETPYEIVTSDPGKELSAVW